MPRTALVAAKDRLLGAEWQQNGNIGPGNRLRCLIKSAQVLAERLNAPVLEACPFAAV